MFLISLILIRTKLNQLTDQPMPPPSPSPAEKRRVTKNKPTRKLEQLIINYVKNVVQVLCRLYFAMYYISVAHEKVCDVTEQKDGVDGREKTCPLEKWTSYGDCG